MASMTKEEEKRLEAEAIHFNSTAEMFAYMDAIDEYEDINDFEDPEGIIRAFEESLIEFEEYARLQK